MIDYIFCYLPVLVVLAPPASCPAPVQILLVFSCRKILPNSVSAWAALICPATYSRAEAVPRSDDNQSESSRALIVAGMIGFYLF